MRITETVSKETEQTTDIICDVCGKSCFGMFTPKIRGNFCGIHFLCSGGYDSSVFPDNEESYEFDVCEHCVETWMLTWPNVEKNKLLAWKEV